jgi:hypothetical protein
MVVFLVFTVQVLHAEDIALYGGICALASFRREELKEKVDAMTTY